MRKINIVLVGKTGNGKSSTGNTILQNLSFEELCSATEGTEMLTMRKGYIDDTQTTKLCVYDTPGIMTLRFDEHHSKGSILKEMETLMKKAEEVHVFIFVFKFNSRFTKDEADTVKDLKAMFGETFLRDHGMVVLTHGDLCDSKAKDVGKTSQDVFKDWCKGAGNDFDNLISEVGKNLFLINNQGDFSATSKRLKSSQELRNMIQHMSKKPTFTKEEFDKINRRCVIL